MFEDIPTLIETMLNKFEIFKCQIQILSDKIVLCQLIGLSISDYNKTTNVREEYQNVINESMPILAHTLNLVNSDENLIGPWMTKVVHYWVNHKLYIMHTENSVMGFTIVTKQNALLQRE